MRKTDPFKPIEFARKAQEQFIETNAAIQKWVDMSHITSAKNGRLDVIPIEAYSPVKISELLLKIEHPVRA